MVLLPEGRRALVAPLPSDPTRLVDLNRAEQARLARLGETRPERLAEALVPPSLRRLLESGPRALLRAAKALSYAEAWARRGDLPELLAPRERATRPLPCLPRPALLLGPDGRRLDRGGVRGPGALVGAPPRPTLAVAGLGGGAPGGFCLALEDGGSAVLGCWLCLDGPGEGFLEVCAGGHRRRAPLDAWAGLELASLRPGGVFLLPPPALRGLPGLLPGTALEVAAPFERMALGLDPEAAHPVVQ